MAEIERERETESGRQRGRQRVGDREGDREKETEEERKINVLAQTKLKRDSFKLLYFVNEANQMVG